MKPASGLSGVLCHTPLSLILGVTLCVTICLTHCPLVAASGVWPEDGGDWKGSLRPLHSAQLLETAGEVVDRRRNQH